MSSRELDHCPHCRRPMEDRSLHRQERVMYTGQRPWMDTKVGYCSADCLLNHLERRPPPRLPWAAVPRRRPRPPPECPFREDEE